jgi:hypothetical protein
MRSEYKIEVYFADGTTGLADLPPRLLAPDAMYERMRPRGWSPDGRFLLYTRDGACSRLMAGR